MSTRATYEFDGGEYRPTVTIYKHSDGYPEGAATWLYNAFRHRKRGLAEGFLRGNPEAQLTTSHEAHGDTEFQYQVRQSGEFGEYEISYRARVPGGNWDFETWSAWEPLVDFMRMNARPDWADDFSPLVHVERLHMAPIWKTTQEAEERHAECLRLLGRWTVEKPLSMEHANANGLRYEVKALELALARGPWCPAAPQEASA